MVNYVREITHQNYGKGQKNLNKYFHKVHKEITVKITGLKKEETLKKNSFRVNSYAMSIPTISKALPHMIGGGALLYIVMVLTLVNTKWSTFGTILFIICCLLVVFFITYLFTMPKKELILNRRDGIITFPGFYWKPNITMCFEDVIFGYSTGGEDIIGAFQLQIIRPTKDYTFFGPPVIGGRDCYEEISFITWYMDKNRPLPTGTAFDEFRQQDFERRKAEGFQRPLYFSKIETPEATLEQQKERKKIGGW